MNDTKTTPSAESALIVAAIELFGREGYAGVSTRSLSEHAGTNISGIKYHFGSKDELYKATVQHVVDQLKPRMDMAMAMFRQGRDNAGKDRTRQKELVKLMVDRLMHMFLESEDIATFLPFVLREFSLPGPYFSIFYESIPRALHTLFTEIVAMIHDLEPDDERAVIQAHAVIGQIMMFHIGRQILFKRLGWDSFNKARVDMIVHEVQQSVINSLSLNQTGETT